jgi:Zn-dependent M28 family amino/carboxypeptidase
MQEFGLEEVALHNFTIQGTTVYNIMGRIYGQNRNEFYLLTAHMDSTAQRSGVNNPAPGADDNGSGTITVLESCRALKAISAQLKKSIICILFNGEELGLLGSKAYVNSLSAAELQKIKGVINMDMVGYAQGESGECVKFGYKDYNGGNILSEKIVSAVNRYAIGLQTGSISTDISASDHAPFWNKGVPAIFASECDLMVYKRGEVYPGYHSVGDKINLVSIPQITKVAKAVTAAVAELALTQ